MHFGTFTQAALGLFSFDSVTFFYDFFSVQMESHFAPLLCILLLSILLKKQSCFSAPPSNKPCAVSRLCHRSAALLRVDSVELFTEMLSTE